MRIRLRAIAQSEAELEPFGPPMLRILRRAPQPFAQVGADTFDSVEPHALDRRRQLVMPFRRNFVELLVEQPRRVVQVLRRHRQHVELPAAPTGFRTARPRKYCRASAGRASRSPRAPRAVPVDGSPAEKIDTDTRRNAAAPSASTNARSTDASPTPPAQPRRDRPGRPPASIAGAIAAPAPAAPARDARWRRADSLRRRSWSADRRRPVCRAPPDRIPRHRSRRQDSPAPATTIASPAATPRDSPARRSRAARPSAARRTSSA